MEDFFFALLQLSSQGSAQHTEKYSEDAKQFESALASEACQFMGHSHLSTSKYKKTLGNFQFHVLS